MFVPWQCCFADLAEDFGWEENALRVGRCVANTDKAPY